MRDDLRTALKNLPDQIEVPTPPSPSKIRRRAARRKGVRGFAAALTVALVAAASFVVQPWDRFGMDPGSPPAADDRGDGLRSAGYLLTSGEVDRRWELSVDVRGTEPGGHNECLWFGFLVEDTSPNLPPQGQEWCDEAILQGGRSVLFHTFRPEQPRKIVFGAVSDEIGALYADVEGPEHPERRVAFEETPEGFIRDDLRFFVIIYGPTADLHVRLTDNDGQDVDAQTVPGTPTFARFSVTYGKGRARVDGTVEIDADAGTFCSEAYLPWAKAGHVHRDVKRQQAGPAPVDPVVLTLFEPPKKYSDTVCLRDLDPVLLIRILDQPDHYYLDFHKSDDGGRTVRGKLGQPRQANT